LNVAIAIKTLQNYGIPGEEIQLAKFASRLKMAGPIGSNWNERLEMKANTHVVELNKTPVWVFFLPG